MRLQGNEHEARPDMRTDFLRKIGPFGAALILILSAVGIFMAFTADLGVPERYESRHDAAYYAQNADTMAELLAELREFVFPSLDGITDSYISRDSKHIVIHADSKSLGRVRAVIARDFSEELFIFESQ